MSTDIAYKKAFIKFVNRQLPELLDDMKRLTRALNDMPRSVRMHP